jgi:arginyl-tRNA synthetase
MNKEQLQVLLMESLVLLKTQGVLEKVPENIRLDHSKDKTQGDFASNIASTSAESGKLALIFCANSLGAHPACLDNIIAIFEAKSPSIINGIVGIVENAGRVGEGT